LEPYKNAAKKLSLRQSFLTLTNIFLLQKTFCYTKKNLLPQQTFLRQKALAQNLFTIQILSYKNIFKFFTPNNLEHFSAEFFGTIFRLN